MARPSFLAFDLGAESGRAILGILDEGHLEVKELTRFPNGMVNLLGHWHWNIVRLFEEVKKGLSLCLAEQTAPPQSLAIDTWGVDFCLLAADGSLLGLPHTYRDPRTEGAMEAFFQHVPRERVYELTGIQMMPINTLYQLFAMVRDRSPLLQVAGDLLFIPDTLNYLLTGEKRTEFTFATTSQLFDPRRNDWAAELFAALGISTSLMQEIVPPGTVVGPLRPEICRETGFPAVPVVATASHDTAAAVAAVPAEGAGWAYISSGTWSLVGIESPHPVITPKTLAFNLTNEGGVERTFRLLKNVAGLWLLQRCRQDWAPQQAYSYGELTTMAASAAPLRSLIDPDYPGFLNPPHMPAAIAAFCESSGQPAPRTPAEHVRCILESLALKHRFVVEQLQQVAGPPVGRIHIVGGGTRNELLCQFTADATGLPVIAGPVEATAIGNLLVQALGLGHIASLAEMREIIRRSFPLRRYEPQQAGPWDTAYERFRELESAS